MTLLPCPACSTPVSPDAAACPRCGHPVAPAAKVKTGLTKPAGCALQAIAAVAILGGAGLAAEGDFADVVVGFVLLVVGVLLLIVGRRPALK